MYHHSHYSVDQKQKLFHWDQKSQITPTNLFESWLRYQNHESLQDFVLSMFQCVEEAKFTLDSLESNVFLAYGLFSRFVLKFIINFHGPVNNFEKIITKWSQFVKKMNSFQLSLGNKRIHC